MTTAIKEDPVVTPTIYALLVGINEYQGDVPRLNGCVNDVKAMCEFLEKRTEGGKFTLNLRVLTAGDPDKPEENKPTRQAVIDGFQNHLGQADAGDVALFYYSGHGSQEKAPPQFWHLEPDHLDETIVCCDSRTEGGWDLADKELAVLIAKVAEKQPPENSPHILVILDACHSGSGTRAIDGIRLAPIDSRDRPLDSFLPGVVQAVAAKASGKPEEKDADKATGDWFALPHGKHVVLSACRPEESAREKVMEGDQLHGVLTYYLLDTLKQVGPSLTYRDVFNRTNTLVRNLISDQHPLIAATESDDLKRPFLGGAIVEQMPYYDVAHEKELGWIIKAGAIHGIARPSDLETTHLAVFPLSQQIKIGDSLEDAVGTAKVIEVGGTQSRIELEMDDSSMPNTKQAYKAVVVATPLPPIAVHLSGNDQPALDQLSGRLKKSLIVRTLTEPGEATIRVVANTNDDQYRLQRAGDLQSLSIAVPRKGTSAAVDVAAARVEHMAQWMQVLKLENTQPQLPAEAVRMELYQYDPATKQSRPLDDGAPQRLIYDPKQNDLGAPLQIRLVHTGKYPKPLYCMLIDLTEDFGIATDEGIFGGGIWLNPGDKVWATNQDGEKFISTYVPEELQALGVTKIKDVFKLIVSTDESDATLFKQNGLEVVLNQTTRGLEKSTKKDVQQSTFHRLLERVQTRAITSRTKKTKLSDWRTTQVSVTTECLRGGVPLPSQSNQSVALADGVTIQGHPSLAAKAELVLFDEGKRDIGNLALPPLFRDHLELAQPFNLRPSRGGDAGPSVIVLRDVARPETVTPETPLEIQAEAQLGKDEVVLAVGFDSVSQLYLPLGIGKQEGNQVKITIDRLPGPTSDSRSIGGSLKLFFQKVIAEKFGLNDETVRLASATVDATGKVIYDDSPITLPEKVRKASRILLYIHGILGDTSSMVVSAYGLKQVVGNPLPKLIEQYDLVLTFDYENINTPIAETAAQLKQSLAKVGLDATHKKTLHIVAHSMGSLVTRWFIERDNGHQIVQKAVLVGPPNAGSPWAKIQDYALVGLGAAMNGLAAMVSPPVIIATLVGTLVTGTKAAEAIDVTLEEMKPNSLFYKTLNASDDPHVQYCVVAGNTSKIVYAQSATEEAEKGLLKKLVERLTSTKTRNNILDWAFFNQPNDMAVSINSMVDPLANRSPKSVPVEVACDHISYFNHEEGLRKVIEQLLRK